jgi:hypothetical protein
MLNTKDPNHILVQTCDRWDEMRGAHIFITGGRLLSMSAVGMFSVGKS